MIEVLRFLVRNWPLKLGAIALATVLYTGLVLSENVQTWGSPVPIVPVRLPSNAVLVGNLPSVTGIRFIAAPDVAARLSSDSFRASIDLSASVVDPERPFVTASVRLEVADSRVSIVDYTPREILVQLDPLISKSVPVEVKTGDVPSGLTVGPPELSFTQVTVSGPASVVDLVRVARATVVIQPSGLDVDADVPLVAVDALGNTVRPVDIRPDTVRVRIRVGSEAQTKTLPVNPVAIGTPAAGYEVVSVSVQPVLVTVEGDPDALAPLARVDSQPISVSGATSDVMTTVGLALPNGVHALSADQVRVVVRIAPQTATRSFSVGLVLAGARDDRQYGLSTDRVTVTVGGTVADLDRLVGRDLVATVDVGALGPGSYPVEVGITLPAGLSVVAVSPPSVTVTVSTPASPSPIATLPPSAAP
ncbi:MAG: hypothetical protein C4343_03740 [Chloroflexota bacterium]